MHCSVCVCVSASRVDVVHLAPATCKLSNKISLFSPDGMQSREGRSGKKCCRRAIDGGYSGSLGMHVCVSVLWIFRRTDFKTAFSLCHYREGGTRYGPYNGTICFSFVCAVWESVYKCVCVC